MTSAITSQTGLTLESLNAAALKRLASAEGPCITIVVPSRHPGSREGSRRNQMLALTQSAADQLRSKKIATSNGDLTDPLKELASAQELEAGGPGFIVFRSSDLFGFFSLTREHPASAVADHHFQLAPFLAEVVLPAEIFVLSFSRKNLRLYRCSGPNCERVELPPSVPDSVEAAEGFEPAEHEANRSTGGPGANGGMGRVHFGTLSDREAAGEYLNYFIAVVDRGLRDLLGGKPLLLSGVHEELSAYRRVARYEHILEAEISCKADYSPLSELAASAANAVDAHYRARAEKEVAAWRNMPDRTHVASGIEDVLRVARLGRIHKLFVADPPTTEAADLAMINATIALTLRTGGDVLTLAPERLTEGMGAVLRY